MGAMFRLAVKNLSQNKIRLALTSFAIVLGVGFVVSSFVLRDGLKEVFSDLSEQVIAGIDIGISANDPDTDPVTQADFDAIADLDGIGAIELQMTGQGYENQLQPVKPDGETITLQGPPQIVFSWSEVPAFDVTDILEGEAPLEPGQWVIDEPSRAEHGFIIGDDYTFITPSGQQEGQLVGTFTFDGFIEGPTFMSMQTEQIQDWMLFGDRFDFIPIAIDGSVPVADLQAEIDETLNGGDTEPRLLVQDQESLIADTQAQFNQALNIIGGILLGFALLSLFVSIFIISNTFAITTSQRTRELGLLRAVGATGSQVLRSVMAESFIIGVLSSLAGIGAGVLIAFGLRAILNTVGLGIPSFGVVLRPATILYALVVGVVVTVIAAIVPAIKASRTPPITAINGRSEAEAKSIGRFVIGGIVTAAGIGLMLLGLFGGGDDVLQVLVPLGAGAAILFIGITLLSPLVAGPLSQLLGTPLAGALGTPGRLARENSARNPRRTATTAAALMIGLSLVSMASVLGESFRAEFDDILNTSVQADFLVISDQADIPDSAVDLIAENPAFGNVTPIKYWGIQVGNEPVDGQSIDARDDPEGAVEEPLESFADIGALDYSQIEGLFDFEVVEGSLADIDDNSAGIRRAIADIFGLGLGDTLETFDLDDEIVELEIVAIYEDAVVSGAVMVSLDRFETLSPQQTSDWVAAQVAEGVTIEEADAEFSAISTEFPNLAFQSSAEFRQTFSDQISFILNLLTVLLALTIIIAVLGIANTLALSVFERTREIGLLRAVGMTRGQTRKMIRWEGVIIAAVGAVLGTALGVALGVLIVNAIPGEFLSAFAIPWVRIGIMVAVTSVMGLLAALFPAWRASRMNVLSAISHA